MKINEIRNEHQRLAKVLDAAESTGKILVAPGVGGKDNPYPLFFTVKELVEHINKGEWHCYNWYLEDKSTMKKEILDVINKLQERLVRL